MDHHVPCGAAQLGELAKLELTPARRPVRLAFIDIIRDKLPRAAAFGRHDIDLPELCRAEANTANQVSETWGRTQRVHCGVDLDIQ